MLPHAFPLPDCSRRHVSAHAMWVGMNEIVAALRALGEGEVSLCFDEAASVSRRELKQRWASARATLGQKELLHQLWEQVARWLSETPLPRSPAAPASVLRAVPAELWSGWDG